VVKELQWKKEINSLARGGGPLCKDANLNLYWSHALDQLPNLQPHLVLCPPPNIPLFPTPSKHVIVLQNVELQNAELQNAEFQNIELQNAELQNAELQNVESYRTSNLTKRRNTKRRILQNVEKQNVDNTKRRKWQAWMVMFWTTNLL
jgi:uncharacterized protein YjbI with pentapeptide repeats